jgi:hypothetical protein
MTSALLPYQNASEDLDRIYSATFAFMPQGKADVKRLQQRFFLHRLYCIRVPILDTLDFVPLTGSMIAFSQSRFKACPRNHFASETANRRSLH